MTTTAIPGPATAPVRDAEVVVEARGLSAGYGVLLFVSVAEHHAQIIADKGIDAKVAPGTWKHIVDDLTAAIGGGHPADGFVAAITAIGAVLAQHFPPGANDPNELPDHLIILW